MEWKQFKQFIESQSDVAPFENHGAALHCSSDGLPDRNGLHFRAPILSTIEFFQ